MRSCASLIDWSRPMACGVAVMKFLISFTDSPEVAFGCEASALRHETDAYACTKQVTGQVSCQLWSCLSCGLCALAEPSQRARDALAERKRRPEWRRVA